MYLVIKSLHIVAAFSWIAGMVVQAVLLRARHSLQGSALPLELNFLREVRRHYRLLTLPAMLLTWTAGLFMAVYGGWTNAAWLKMKLPLVILLTVIHGVLEGTLRGRTEGPGPARPAVSAYVLPGVLTIVGVIVFLVVTKPI